MKTKTLFLAALTLGAATILHGQVSYNTIGGVYAEDFGDLNPDFTGSPETGTPHDWNDNTTVTGWYASLDAYFSHNNPTVTSRMYNLREGSSATDQTLGSVPGLGSGTIYFGLRLVNDTGSELTSFDIGYDGQQWRNSGNETASEIDVSWRLGEGGLEDGSWSDEASLTFTAIHTGGDADNMNGNFGSNSENLFATISGLSWQPGEELWVRWGHASHSGENHGLGIDDVSFAAVPEPSYFALGAGLIGAVAVLLRRRFRE